MYMTFACDVQSSSYTIFFVYVEVTWPKWQKVITTLGKFIKVANKRCSEKLMLWKSLQKPQKTPALNFYGHTNNCSENMTLWWVSAASFVKCPFPETLHLGG